MLNSLVIAAAVVASGGCGLGAGVCDELDRRPNGSCPPPDQQAGQTLHAFRAPNQSDRPPVGSAVDVRNVVISAIDDYAEGSSGRTGNVWIQEIVTDPNFQGCVPAPGGVRVCGMELFAPTFIPTGAHPLLGDLVNVSGGTYDEFVGPSSSPFTGRTLPELSMTVTERIGTTRPPEPVPVTLAQIAMGGDAYVGVVVRVTDDVVTMAPNRRGEIPLDQGITIAPDLSPITDPMSGMPIAAGTHLHNLTGVVSYFYNAKILPRSPAELGIVR